MEKRERTNVVRDVPLGRVDRPHLAPGRGAEGGLADSCEGRHRDGRNREYVTGRSPSKSKSNKQSTGVVGPRAGRRQELDRSPRDDNDELGWVEMIGEDESCGMLSSSAAPEGDYVRPRKIALPPFPTVGPPKRMSTSTDGGRAQAPRTPPEPD